MTELVAGAFTIKSHLERPADDFDADVADSATWLAASETDRITLQAGYRDLAGTPSFVSQIQSGIVDEWELTFEPTAQVTRLRGRDPITQLLERRLALLFPRAPERPVTDTLATEAEGGGNVATLAVTRLPAGRWTATQVAATVVATVNETIPPEQQFGLSWQTRDYELRADYSAAGRPVDILRDLAEPWSQADPTRVDVILEGLTIVVRGRNPLPTADYVFALGDARIRSATLTKRRPRRLGHVVLSGMLVQIEGTGLVGETIPDPTSPAKLLEIETTPNRTELETRTPNAINRYRMPDGVLVYSQKTVLTGTLSGGTSLVARDTTRNTWDDVEYDQGQPLRAALQRTQDVLVEGIHPQDKAKLFRQLRSESVTYEYDGQEFLTRIVSTKKEINLKSNTLELSEMITKDYTDIGPLLYEVVTSVLKWNQKLGVWNLSQRDAATSSGYRPGGPGRSKVTFIPAGTDANGNPIMPGQNNSGQRIPITLERTLSEAPDAEPFSYANEHLTLADLEFIMSQLEAAQELWEVEVSLDAVTMPWLRRGVVLQLTNCRDEFGELMPLDPNWPPGAMPPALVLEHLLSFRRPREGDAAMTSQVRALYYSAGG
jgi:hypothetical protein